MRGKAQAGKAQPMRKRLRNSVLARAVVIDAQGVAILMPQANIQVPARDPRETRCYVRRAIDAGVSALNISLGVGGIGVGVDSFRNLIGTIHGYLGYIDIRDNLLVQVEAVDDIIRAKREGKLGIIFGVQDLGTKLEGDLTLITILHKLGLRIGQLTLNERNLLGCGCQEDPDTGLTQLGRAAIREMNHLGIVVDIAHSGERTALEAIELSSKPVIVSHGNARAVTDNPRNVTDAALDALAAKGGVVGLAPYSPLCERKHGTRPTVEDYIAHIEYVAGRIGIEHVGIGSDFFEGSSEVRYGTLVLHYPRIFRGYGIEERYASGFDNIDAFPRLAEALCRHGFNNEQIEAVLGGNLLRVFKNAWRN